tara:strand:+ start:2948 stop:3922 length:975 start_codon:yes stop_codon:yes gene_type:complete
MTDILKKKHKQLMEAAARVSLFTHNTKHKIKLKQNVASKLNNDEIPDTFDNGDATSERTIWMFTKESYQPILSHLRKTRSLHNQRVIPSGIPNVDILSARHLAGLGTPDGKAWDDLMRDRQHGIAQLADVFFKDLYPQQFDNARRVYSKIWNDISGHYKSAEEVRREISMDFSIECLPAASTWLKMDDLPKEMKKRLHDSAKAEADSQGKLYKKKFIQILQDVVGKVNKSMLKEGKVRVDGYAVFHETMIEALNDKTIGFEGFNFDDDPDLAEVHRDLKEITMNGTITKEDILDGGQLSREIIKDQTDDVLLKLNEIQIRHDMN